MKAFLGIVVHYLLLLLLLLLRAYAMSLLKFTECPRRSRICQDGYRYGIQQAKLKVHHSSLGSTGHFTCDEGPWLILCQLSMLTAQGPGVIDVPVGEVGAWGVGTGGATGEEKTRMHP